MKTKVMIALSVFGLSQVAMANGNGEVKMETGVYYELGENLARGLNINLVELKAQAKLQNGERLVIKTDEQDQLDITIFDQGQFQMARLDLLEGL